MTAITIPDLVSLSYTQAYRIGTGAGLVVHGVGPDGQPVGDESERVVVDQDPMAGETLRPGGLLTLRVGRPPDKSGEREPVDPGPRGHEARPEPDPVHVPDVAGDREGPPPSTNADPDLVPA